MLPDDVNRDLPPVSTWQAEILRLTAFPSPAAEIPDHQWWSAVVGQPPDTTVLRARQGELQSEGPIGAGKLILRIQPGRIEWRFRPPDRQIQEAERLPAIGSFPETLDTFLPLMLRWFELDTCPSLERLAFGATLWQSVENQVAGYRQIARYLPRIQLDPEGSSDFIYQINRPRPSRLGIEHLRINRLSKWSVFIFQNVEFLFGPATEFRSPGSQYFACRSELDINTSQNFEGELPREQLAQIFRELIDLGREIAEQGDIP